MIRFVVVWGTNGTKFVNFTYFKPKTNFTFVDYHSYSNYHLPLIIRFIKYKMKYVSLNTYNSSKSIT